jgi:hypothetical protein
MLMNTDDGGVDDQIFEVWIIGHGKENPLPDAFLAPPAETAEHTVPIAENRRQVTPWRARSHDPQHTFDKHPVVMPGRAALIRTAYD